MEIIQMIAIVFITFLPPMVAALMKWCNARYVQRGKAISIQRAAEEYAHSILEKGEKLIMVDYPTGGRECVVLTDRRIFHAKKGKTVFQATYNEVLKIRFENIGGSKVSAHDGVASIHITSIMGDKARLYGYIYADHLAVELSKRFYC